MTSEIFSITITAVVNGVDASKQLLIVFQYPNSLQTGVN
jgi:hypothetical protein